MSIDIDSLRNNFIDIIDKYLKDHIEKETRNCFIGFLSDDLLNEIKMSDILKSEEKEKEIKIFENEITKLLNDSSISVDEIENLTYEFNNLFIRYYKQNIKQWIDSFQFFKDYILKDNEKYREENRILNKDINLLLMENENLKTKIRMNKILMENE